jgi:hypothetical protein
MFSIASSLRIAAAGLVLATAAATPTLVRADGLPVPNPSIPIPNPDPGIPGLPQPPPLRFPDLVMVASPSYQPIRGRSALVRTRLQNLGLGATTRAFSVRATISVIHAGVDLPYRTLPMRTLRITRLLTPGASMDLDLGLLTASAGDTVLIEGTVDSLAEIGESNERNNRFSLRVAVR